MDSVPTDSEDAFLVAYLRDRDVECPICQYNLRNLQTDRCPECGEHLTIQLAPAEAKQKLLIVGLVGLASGLGFNALLLLYWYIITFRRTYRSGSDDVRIVGQLSLGVAVFGALVWAWTRWWPRLRQQSVVKRAILAFFCYLLALVDVVIFALTVS